MCSREQRCGRNGVVLGICSRSSTGDFDWLKRFLTAEFQELISEVKYFEINNKNKFLWEDKVKICDVVILYHTQNYGSIAITDKEEALYDGQLTYLSKTLGREQVMVVLDDMATDSDDERQRILRDQPSIQRLSSYFIIFTDNKNHEAASRKKREFLMLLNKETVPNNQASPPKSSERSSQNINTLGDQTTNPLSNFRLDERVFTKPTLPPRIQGMAKTDARKSLIYKTSESELEKQNLAGTCNTAQSESSSQDAEIAELADLLGQWKNILLENTQHNTNSKKQTINERSHKEEEEVKKQHRKSIAMMKEAKDEVTDIVFQATKNNDKRDTKQNFEKKMQEMYNIIMQNNKCKEELERKIQEHKMTIEKAYQAILELHKDVKEHNNIIKKMNQAIDELNKEIEEHNIKTLEKNQRILEFNRKVNKHNTKE